MNNEEYQRGFEDGEDFTITNVESYLTNLSTDKLWSLFSAVQVELEGRDDSSALEETDVSTLVFPACGSFD